MVGELLNVLGCHEVDSLRSTFNVTDFEDLGVVTEHVGCHLERRHVDNVDIWVFGGKDSADLSILTL